MDALERALEGLAGDGLRELVERLARTPDGGLRRGIGVATIAGAIMVPYAFADGAHRSRVFERVVEWIVAQAPLTQGLKYVEGMS